MSWLYRYETKGIQRWILASGRLRELVGGSLLVDALTDEARQCTGLPDEAILQAAAGGLTARFESREKLERFASLWPRYVAMRAPGLMVVQAWVEEADPARDFGALRARIAAARNEPAAAFPEAGPWLQRAARSGLPAVPPPPDLSGRRAQRPTFDLAAVARESARNAMSDSVGGLTGDFAPPDEWRCSHVAVIHADGTGVGARITKLVAAAGGDASRQIRSFSTALAEATREATRAAVAALGGGRKLEVRPIVVGGDDLTFVVAARHGLPFVRAWLHAFEHETGERRSALGGDRLTAGAGLVWVNRKYPFDRALGLAEEACNAAKQVAKRQASGTGESALQLHRVTTSLADEHVARWTWTSSTLEARGTDAPIDRLRAAVALLPRGTVRTWLGHHDRGDQHSATALLQRARDVAGDTTWRKVKEALVACGADPERWSATGGDQVAGATPVRDVIDSRHMHDEYADLDARGGAA